VTACEELGPFGVDLILDLPHEKRVLGAEEVCEALL
jgi:hypothetical protein